MFLGILVSVVVLLSGVYVPFISNAHATSTDVVITQIQAGGVGAPTQEFIVIYNNSPLEVDISGWCLTNKNGVTIVCFTSQSEQPLYIPGYKHAVAASNTLPINLATIRYEPINQTSGSMTGSADKISLINRVGGLVDQYTWTSPITGGMHATRNLEQIRPLIYQDTGNDLDWTIVVTMTVPKDEMQSDQPETDVCPNIDGMQSMVPPESYLSELGECLEQVVAGLDITEVLPNAPGSDAGQEFIEIYNPNEYPVDLSGYRLRIGLSYENEYMFPAGTVIESRSYKSFSNTDIPYSLLNTSSQVMIIHDSGKFVGEAPAYQDPKDGQSWALIDGIWRYVATPTPGLTNVAAGSENVAEIEKPEIIPQSCAVNQYRSPETNRCRLISSSTTTSTACKDGQYRSEETNRCRNIATDAKVITPCEVDEERNAETNRCRKIVAASQPSQCKEGQERNPDTNRCRTVTKMPNADYGVLGAETKSNGSWYILAAVGGVLLIAIGYAVWEWRDEIGKFIQNVRKKAAWFIRTRK